MKPIRIIPILLALLILLFDTVVIIYTQFDGLYGQDPYGYYDYARALYAGTALHNLIQTNYWPAGYPLLIAALFRLFGEQALAAQLPSVIAGAAMPALLMMLIYELALLEQRTTEQALYAGLVAGLVACSGGQYTQWSVSALSDTPALGWATLAIWAVLRWARTARYTWLIATGFFTAAAISTRWIYAILLPIIGLYIISTYVAAYNQKAYNQKHLLSKYLVYSGFNKPQATICTITIVILLFGLIVLIGLLPQLWLSQIASGELAHSHWISGWSLSNALQHRFMINEGHLNYPLPVGLFYLRAIGSPRIISPLYWPLLLAGLWSLWRWRMQQAALLLLTWIGLVYLFLAGLPSENLRFTLTQLPAIAGLAGFGAAWLVSHLPRLRTGLVICYLLGSISAGWYGLRLVQDLTLLQQTDRATAHWVEQQLPVNAHLLAFELTLTIQHNTTLHMHELYGIQKEQLAQELALDRPLFLLVETDKLQRQWAGTPIEASYQWLRDGPGLVPIGQMNGYALYRVKAEG